MYSTLINNKNQLENALAYAQRGYAVFPVHVAIDGKCSCGKANCDKIGKHPWTQHGYKNATTNPDVIRGMFWKKINANIGIATGEPSGVWVFDVDDPAKLTELEIKYGKLPTTPTVQTSRGFHFYFRFTRADLINTNKFCGALDVRTTGGYAILPPSVHPLGHVYSWLVSPDECDPADAPAWLVDLVPKRNEPKRKAGLTFTITDDVDARIRNYLAKCPPAISGESGHGTTFGVICRVVETFPELRQRDDDEILELLDDWNGRCEPPWSENELRHKIQDARTQTETQGAPSFNDNPIEEEKDTDADNPDDDDEHEPVDEPVDEWPTLHADALHGYAGEFVKTIEPHTEADSVAILLTLLAMFGNCVGRQSYMYVGGDKHHANLYINLIGQSSSARKGTSYGVVRELFNGIDETWQKSIVYSGMSSGEGVIASVADHETEITETGSLTWTARDKRRLCVETEFGQVLRVLKRDGNTLSGVIRNAWDRGELSVLTRNNPLRATGAHVSVIGHITRDELTRYLDNVDIFNGFANRFLWALVKRSKLLPEASRLPFDELRKKLKVIVERAKSVGEMTRTPACASLWHQVYPSLCAEKRGLWDASTSRAEAQALRLSMLYALLDGSETIDVPHLRASLAVWRYCDDSARILFNPKSGDGSVELKIRRFVQANPGATRSQIRNAVDHKMKASELTRSLDWLVGRGEIERRRRKGRVDKYYPTVSPPLASFGDNPKKRRGRVDGERCEPPLENEGLPVDDVDEQPELTENEFLERMGVPADTIDVPADPLHTPTRTATLTELIDWRNAHGASFVRGEGGLIGLSPCPADPSLLATVRANQETLTLFLQAETETAPTPTEADEEEKRWDEDFIARLRAIAC